MTAIITYLLFITLSRGYSITYSDKSTFGSIWKHILEGGSTHLYGEYVSVVADNGNTFTGRRIDSSVTIGGVSRVNWFLGIPYAKPPISNLRFKFPRAYEKTTNKSHYTRFSDSCTQGNGYKFTNPMSEDCLYLNVFAPVMNNTDLLPVMFYIHGGSYRVGGAKIYPGAILAQHKVIVVTINYRLGVLGFLCNSKTIHGNFGLEDQLQALLWVKSNINAFGGDNNKVTIFGNSAGASSVGFLNMSPRTKGLFRTVILQSGSPNAYWASYRFAPTSVYETFSRKMGCYNKDDTEDCLMNSNTKDLIKQASQLPVENFPTRTAFKPCSHIDKESIIPSPDNMTLSSRYIDGVYIDQWISKVNHSTADTIIVGYVREEWTRMIGWFFEDTDYLKEFLDSPNGEMSLNLFKNVVTYVMTKRFDYHLDLVKLIIDEYLNNTHPSPENNRDSYIQMMTDKNLVYPIVDFIDSTLINNNKQRQLFAYEMALRQNKFPGSLHTLELEYIFGSPFLGIDTIEGDSKTYNDSDRILSRALMKTWSNIAKYRSPSDFSEWKAMTVSARTGHYVKINDLGEVISLKGDYRNDKRMHFWRIMDEINDRFQHSNHGTIHSWMKNEAVFTYSLYSLACILALITMLALLATIGYSYRRYVNYRKINRSIPLKNRTKLHDVYEIND